MTKISAMNGAKTQTNDIFSGTKQYRNWIIATFFLLLDSQTHTT